MRPARCFIRAEFQAALAELGLTSCDAGFAFEGGRELAKPNIGRFRRRLQLEVTPTDSSGPVRVFLKRYDRPPILPQLRNWLVHRRRTSFARTEADTAQHLAVHGVNTPRLVAWGERWGVLFERGSFVMMEEIKDSESLERRLPPCLESDATRAELPARRDFLRRLALFIRRFHETGFRHRDLYLCHIFYSRAGQFSLIDLARASRPILRRRFQVKDIAQLHYSAPAAYFSRADRLRFYLAYADRRRLRARDKVFLGRVIRKAAKMARHSAKHGIRIPFLER